MNAPNRSEYSERESHTDLTTSPTRPTDANVALTLPVRIALVEDWSRAEVENAASSFLNSMAAIGTDHFEYMQKFGLLEASRRQQDSVQQTFYLGVRPLQINQITLFVSSYTACLSQQCTTDVYVDGLSVKYRFFSIRNLLDEHWNMIEMATRLLARWRQPRRQEQN